jgi:hypothetical protein
MLSRNLTGGAVARARLYRRDGRQSVEFARFDAEMEFPDDVAAGPWLVRLEVDGVEVDAKMIEGFSSECRVRLPDGRELTRPWPDLLPVCIFCREPLYKSEEMFPGACLNRRCLWTSWG